MKYMQHKLDESFRDSDSCRTAPPPGRHLHANSRIE